MPEPEIVKPEFVNLYQKMLVDSVEAKAEQETKQEAEQETAEFWEEEVDRVIAEDDAWVSLYARACRRHKYWASLLQYYLKDPENWKHIIKMRHNMLPWRGDEDDVWLTSVVEAFDATMRWVTDDADVVAFDCNVPEGSSNATVEVDSHWQH